MREPRVGEPVLGLPPNLVLAALAFATFCCCVTMSMPMAHMVAFCSDIGIAPTQGAAMLSVLLVSAFFARQFWGWFADRVGGLRTILWASAAQAAAMTGYLLTQNEMGLFTISAAFGFGFGGLIPGYVLAVRELFPASEASWRIPTMLFPGSLGMAAGGWVAGVMYDHFAFYTPAFAVGRPVQPAEPCGDRRAGDAPPADAPRAGAGLNTGGCACRRSSAPPAARNIPRAMRRRPGARSARMNGNT